MYVGAQFSAAQVGAYDTWRQAHFGTTSLVGNFASSADYDADGVANLLEYASGTSPASAADVNRGEIFLSGFTGEFDFALSKAAIVSRVVEWSDSLLSGWNSTGVRTTIQSDNGTTQQIRAYVPTGGTGRRFVRLRAYPPQ